MIVLFLLSISVPLISSIHIEHGDIGIAHVEPVLNFHITGHGEGPDLIEHGHTQPHAEELEISFSAFNRQWDLDLYCNHGMFSPTSVFNFTGSNPDEKVTILPDHTVYLSKEGSKIWASVNIYEDATIHAILITENGTYTIDPVSEFPEFDLHSKMAMYHHDDLLSHGESHESEHLFSSRSLLKDGVFYPSSRKLLQQLTNDIAKDINPRGYSTTTLSDDETPKGGMPQRWANCYPGGVEQRFSMGLAVTGEYYDQVCGKGVAAGAQKQTACINHLKNLMADSNTIYVPQMGVHLYIESTIIRTDIRRTAPYDPVWNMAQQQAAAPRNSGCGEDASETLGKFRLWRSQLPKEGLWHLMTTCFPAPGTVGIAYLNAICQTRVGSGLSSSLSARNPGSRAIWKVVAHEIGHNFGGGHSFELGQGTTGGIMDYGDGKLNGIYQFNSRFRQARMCQIISAAKARPVTQQCFTNYPLTNGKQYGWIEGPLAPCPVTCASTPPPTTSQGYVCSECTTTPQAPLNICLNPTGAPVANNMCPQPQPLPQRKECVGLPPCGAARCGDGKVDPGEECDGGSCCSSTCKRIQCEEIDACFNSVKNLKTYCFKGDTYSRYSPLQSKTAREATYPRLISQYWPNLPAGFTSDYDAIIQRKEGRIYFIKALQYAVYELGFGAHNGGAQPLSNLFTIPTGWTKIDAAVSLNSGQGGAYVFSGAEFCMMSFAPNPPPNDMNCPNKIPIALWNNGQAFPTPTITAARRYWPELGVVNGQTTELNLAVDLLSGDKFYTYTFGQGLSPTPTTLEPWGASDSGLPDPIQQKCRSGCLDCSGNVNICLDCDQDFQLVSGQCYPIEYVVEMLFDDATFSQDQVYVKNLPNGAKDTNVPNEDWNGLKSGNTKQAIILDNTKYIKIDVTKIPNNMIDWEFHFWVRLNSNAQDVETNLVAGRLQHGPNNYDISFYLKPAVDMNFNKVGGQWFPTYKIVKYNADASVNKTTRLQSDFSIKKLEWAHLIATLKEGNMEITIDGGTLPLPFDDPTSTAAGSVWKFIAFEIGKSSLGAAQTREGVQYSGIDGWMDQFHIDVLKTTDIEESGATNDIFRHLFVFLAVTVMALY